MAQAALGGSEQWADLSAQVAQNSSLPQRLAALSCAVGNTSYWAAAILSEYGLKLYLLDKKTTIYWFDSLKGPVGKI
jgi:rhodanese-related sulfurtransferase